MSIQDFALATKGDCYVNVILIGNKNRVIPIIYADMKEAKAAKIEAKEELRADGIKAKVKTLTVQEAADIGYKLKDLLMA